MKIPALKLAGLLLDKNSSLQDLEALYATNHWSKGVLRLYQGWINMIKVTAAGWRPLSLSQLYQSRSYATALLVLDLLLHVNE